MTDWVISVSDDGCEVQLTSVDNLSCDPQLQLDTEGNPMIQVKHFEADTWDEAKAVMDAWVESQDD